MVRIGLWSLVALALASCASLSKNDCVSGDWEGLGQRDGIDGRRKSQLDAHRKTCADHGVTPDSRAYWRGYARGLEAYCAPQNAFVLGRRGETYENVCPSHLEVKFLPRFRAGAEAFDLDQRLMQLGTELSNAEDRLSHAQSEGDRQQARRDTDRLRAERERLLQRLTLLDIRQGD